ncbi:MAG TPA: trypsin-like peptidase domain-containing protein [Pirellulales bacterium]|jgi:S1-C subfamily serine protease|nr:trypsin-like peptidase domain-containing protein [Pirellulales bacterium]
MRKNVVLCLLSAVLGGVLAAGLWNQPNPAHRVTAAEPPAVTGPRIEPVGTPGNEPLPVAVRARAAVEDDLTPEERVNVAVYENVNRSVVNIVTKIPGTAGFLMFDNTEVGAGSGSVLDKRGHILTNYHVIEGAKEIEVTLFDGTQHDARLVGRDISSDVAVIQIEAPPDVLFPVFFGDSTRLKVGQKVFAIGNPFGFDRTLTTGIISSLDRSIPARNDRTIKSIIQIDAAINPGNSGGPLLDSHGRLIGMNTAIASRTGQNTGIGFAIPVNNISRVVPELIEKGHVVRPETGITRVYQTEQGLYVVTMATGGPAEQAGLRGFKVVKQVKRQGPFTYQTETVDRSSADLIIGVNGEKTLTRNDFLNAIEAHHPGEDVILNVIREGRQIAVRLRLAAAES